MDFSRLRTGEIVAALGGIALFVFLFFDWFGIGDDISNGFVGGGRGFSGWDSLGGDVTGFIVALTSVAGVVLALLAASGQKVNVPLPRGAATAVLGTISVAIILWRMLSVSEGLELEFGIFLGLAAAVAIAIGAVIALIESGFQPLVAVPGGRTRAAAASAPPATPTPRPATAPSGGSTSRSSGSGSSTKSGPRAKPTSKRSTSTRSGSRKTAAKGTTAPRSGSRKTTKRSASSKSSSSRSSASRSSSTKSRGSSRAKSSATRSRSRSGGSKSSGSKSRSTGTRRRSSGGRKK